MIFANGRWAKTLVTGRRSRMAGLLQGHTGPAPGAAGYWGRDAKNKRVWVPSGTPGDAAGPAATLKLYVESENQEREMVQAQQLAEEHRARKASYVNCFRNFTPRSDSAMTSRSKVSLASSIAFSNNPWEGKPKIGGTPVYMKVGSRCFKAPSFEPADCQYERTPPPDIPHTSTSQESFRWPRASPRYNRDRLHAGKPTVDSDDLHDGVPLYGSVGVRTRTEAYDWTLTRHRYLMPQVPNNQATSAANLPFVFR